jgi:hypothetical protein
MPGTPVRKGTVGAVVNRGERFYMITCSGGIVSLMPADIIEREVLEDLTAEQRAWIYAFPTTWGEMPTSAMVANRLLLRINSSMIRALMRRGLIERKATGLIHPLVAEMKSPGFLWRRTV